MKQIITVKDTEHLLKLIKDEINLYSLECDLNHLDVSKWDASNVTNMKSMFSYSKFKGDSSDWLPYKLENKGYMFENCSAPTPYWYTAENTQKAIETYQLKNKLEDNLSDINKSVNKIKI